MKRILILGCSGAGKSTLANALGDKLNVPVYHLDAYRWKNGKDKLSDEDFEKEVQPLLEKSAWIMDGNYRKHLAVRLRYADTVVFLDTPRIICVARIIARDIQESLGIKKKNDGRPDLDFHYNFFKLLFYTWTFPKKGRKKAIKVLEEHGQGKQIVFLHSQKEMGRFLATISVSI